MGGVRKGAVWGEKSQREFRSEDRSKALRSGFQMHLAKPIDPGELMAAMATLSSQGNATQD